MKAKINLKNIRSFVQGNWRAALLEYYPDGLPKHVEEQYYWRIQQVAEESPECLENKECKKCHCAIPELFMADKACENNPPCYPEMMSKKQWEEFTDVHYGGSLEENTSKDFIVGYDDAPGIKGKKFKIKLSKDQFSGNMTPEQIQGIANEYKDYL